MPPSAARRAKVRHGFPEASRPSAVTATFQRLLAIPGWFTIDDCAHFELILAMQTLTGITGDLLEIGAYFGRSAAFLGSRIAAGERLVLCDVFASHADVDWYPAYPTVADLARNLRLIAPELPPAAVEIHECRSAALDLAGTPRFRFAHVDGGHSKDDALGDLIRCYAALVPGGVLAIDDHAHVDWPQVTEAIDAFRQTHTAVEIADLNRFGERGRKLYLAKPLTGTCRSGAIP